MIHHQAMEKLLSRKTTNSTTKRKYPPEFIQFANWIRKLRTEDKHFLDWKSYKTEAARLGISGKEGGVRRLTKATEYLSHIGSILHFGNDQKKKKKKKKKTKTKQNKTNKRG